MTDRFEFVVNRHGEIFIWDILENWERHNGIQQMKPMTLEQRWHRFLVETDTNLARLAA